MCIVTYKMYNFVISFSHGISIAYHFYFFIITVIGLMLRIIIIIRE
jgi:hypothetical protein